MVVLHRTICYSHGMDGMTIADAARVLGMSENGIRRRIQRGDMVAERIGARLLVIPNHEVERWRSLGKLKPGPRPARERKEQRLSGSQDTRQVHSRHEQYPGHTMQMV